MSKTHYAGITTVEANYVEKNRTRINPADRSLQKQIVRERTGRVDHNVDDVLLAIAGPIGHPGLDVIFAGLQRWVPALLQGGFAIARMHLSVAELPKDRQRFGEAVVPHR
jgi:hypothetical protein